MQSMDSLRFLVLKHCIACDEKRKWKEVIFSYKKRFLVLTLFDTFSVINLPPIVSSTAQKLLEWKVRNY